MKNKKIRIMKNVISLFMCSAILFAFSACASKNTPQNTTGNYIQTEKTKEETQEVLLADKCQYTLATGYDDDGTCYQLVGEDYEDYQGSQIRLGIIKNNEWLIKMTAETPFIDKYNCIYGSQSLNNDYILEGYGTLKNAISDSKSNLYDRIGYIGKGSFYLLGTPRKTGGYFIEDELQTIVFWNCETNTSKVLNNITMDDMNNYIQSNDVVISELVDYDFRLSNNAFATLDVKLLNPETFKTKRLFSKKLTVNNKMSNNIHQISDGLFYSDGSFYKTNGNKAFDVNIKNIHEIGHFNNGKCEIITQIDTGTKYKVVIDTNGKVTSNEKIE